MRSIIYTLGLALSWHWLLGADLIEDETSELYINYISQERDVYPYLGYFSNGARFPTASRVGVFDAALLSRLPTKTSVSYLALSEKGQRRTGFWPS